MNDELTFLRNLPHLGLVVIAWFVMDRVTPLLIRLAGRVGAYDVPHTYKTHREPVPYLGGVAIYLAFCAAIFATLRFGPLEAHRPLFGILLGGFIVTVFGLLDDVRGIHAVVKLAVLIGATYLLSRFDLSIQLTGFWAADLALTLLWLAGLTSAMNSLDNMDGAAGGVAAIASFFTFLVTFREPAQPGAGYFALALFGATVGFLGYNYAPARIFLGNNGAFLLGFLLASLMVMTGWASGDHVKALIVPCAILVVPLYDITLSTVLRIVQRRVRSPLGAIVYCGRDHFAHRLVALYGFSRPTAVNWLYACGFVGGAIGYVISSPDVGPKVYLPITALSLGVLIGVGFVLRRAPVYAAEDAAKAAEAAAPAAAPAQQEAPAGEAR